MNDVLIKASSMSAIGEAIREKTGGVALIYPKDMAAQISSIKTGAVLQEKTIAPTTSQQEVTPDAEYDGLSKVTVEAMQVSNTASPVIEVSDAGLIQASVQYNEGYITEDTRKTAVKQLPIKAGERVIPSTTDKVAIEAGVFTTWPVTVAGDANLVPENIKKNESIFGIVGTYEGEGGGGGSDLVRYVTFLNEDGTTLYQMPVLVGDDCKDPITHGDISTPTKESTAANHFTYSGWTSTVGGTADADILKNITEDKTVYVAYAVSTRYYTVNFYANDALFETVQVPYGGTATPTNTPTKDGYSFSSWDPSPTNVTADMDCYAVWVEGIKFATASWEKIAEICEAGEAEQYFKLGDEKEINYYTPWGATMKYNVKIIGFYHDNLADGTGKAGITCRFTSLITNSYTAATQTNGQWSTLTLRTGFYASTLPNRLDSDFVAAVKPVTKQTVVLSSLLEVEQYETTTDKFWDLSSSECGFKDYPNEGEMYPIFVENSNKRLSKNYKFEDLALGVNFRLRSDYNNYSYTVAADGDYGSSSSVQTSTMPCFCV